MKTRIIRTEWIGPNHNQGALKVKPQLTHLLSANHNQGALKVR